jgi:uncharacterized C2H2 Zn-finger protein
MSDDENSDFNNRKCPYCGQALTNRPYWRHVEQEHPDEYATDKATWIQLFKDYTAMGMDQKASLTVISELFNQKPYEIEEFLRENGAID